MLFIPVVHLVPHLAPVQLDAIRTVWSPEMQMEMYIACVLQDTLVQVGHHSRVAHVHPVNPTLINQILAHKYVKHVLLILGTSNTQRRVGHLACVKMECTAELAKHALSVQLVPLS